MARQIGCVGHRLGARWLVYAEGEVERLESVGAPMTRHLASALLLLLACNLPEYTTTAGPDSTTTTATTGTSGVSMSATSHAPTTTTTTSISTSPWDSVTLTSSISDTDCEFGCTDLMCNLWEQDCPEGQKCMPWANDGGNTWNASKCVDVMPNAGKPGDPCSVQGNGLNGIDSCDKASACWNIDPDTGKGTCVGFCKGSPDVPNCPLGTSCFVGHNGLLPICVPFCDPLLQNCMNGDLCIPQPLMGDAFECAPDASGDMGAQNDPCEYTNACDPGLLCLNSALASECNPNVAGCCLPFCDLTMPECTNQGATCVPWYAGTAPPGLENVGVCSLMP